MKPKPELITKALQALDTDLGKEVKDRAIFNDKGEIPNRFKGYISTFGGSIVQLGIMPACMALMADSKKEKFGNMLFEIYLQITSNTFAMGMDEYLKAHWVSMDKKLFRKQMTSIAVSMKLAMRTYKFDENDAV